MSRLESTQEKLLQLQKAICENNIDDLLDRSTPSLPAIWHRESRSFIRIHLPEDHSRLTECKQVMKELKEDIKQQLILECGEDSWDIRMPIDVPITSKDDTFTNIA